MKLLSVNIGKAKPIASKSGMSGIFKEPQTNPVHVGELGLAGDAIMDTKNHGGPDQAVYIYFQPDYKWWENQLNQQLPPGTFGENLTLSEMQSTQMHIADRLVFEEVVLEVTSPRIPCTILAARMNNKMFVRQFMRAGRPGVYCRVITEGMVQTGEAVNLTPASEPRTPANSLLKNFAFLSD